MPKKLESCVNQVMAKGQDKSGAYAICNASINKGSTKKGKGKKK
jgi:hypothetical protein